jgi:hypothetical protein
MQFFLDRLSLVAHEPLTYVAFLVLVGAWLWRAYFLRTKSYITSLASLPKKDQLSGLQLLVLGYPQDVTSNQLKLLQQRYLLVAFIATVVGVIILAGLFIHYWSLPADEVKNQLGTIQKQGADTAQQVGTIQKHVEDQTQAVRGIRDQLNDLGEKTAKLDTSLDQYLKRSKQSEEPPQVDELMRVIAMLATDLGATKKQLAEYAGRYGPLPKEKTGQIAQAEQALRRAERVLVSEVTLKNTFIEQYKDRVTVDSNLLVDSVGRVHSPSTDGDIHIAGRDTNLGFVLVAEIMNAVDEKPAIDLVRKAQGTMRPVAINGVWRLWFERPSESSHVQGQPPAPVATSNPDHVFEVHPVTHVEAIETLKSVRRIEGYTAHQARRAFLLYERMPCRIVPDSATTKLTTKALGFNYVEFILEATSPPSAVEGGWMLQANVRDGDGELLVRSLRTVFIKGTDPADRLAKLGPGNRLRVIGMPRISLAEVSSRVQGAARNPESLRANLPYEMVIVGVCDNDA